MSILASAPDSFCERNCCTRMSIAAVTALRTSLSSLPTIGFSCLLLECVLCLIDNRFKCCLVSNGKIGENLSIKADAGGFQSFCKTTVANPVCARCSVQALDPKVTERAFACLTIAIGPILAFHRRVFCVAEKFRTASAVTFGLL